MVFALGIELEDGVASVQKLRMGVPRQHILGAYNLAALLAQVFGQVENVHWIDHQGVFQIAAAPSAALAAKRDARVVADVLQVFVHIELLP